MLSHEVSLISDNEISAFTEIVLNNAPKRFWVEPASSTGKYHPHSSNGISGLVMHTRQVFHIAKAILDTGVFDVNRDIVLSACLLHDIAKYDDNSRSKYTVRDHAGKAVEYISELSNIKDFMSIYDRVPDWFHEIMYCISRHDGKFNKKNTERLNAEQSIVHLADYIASRRWCGFDYERIRR